MPRAKKAIPTKLEGRNSIASVLEVCSEDAMTLAGRLRKPASLVEDERVHEAFNCLMSAAQCLSDVSVGVHMGRVDVLQADAPAEVQGSLLDLMEHDDEEGTNG